MSKRDDYAQTVADGVIKALEAGTAPWQRPYKAGAPRVGGMPFNPTTGKPYRGGNAVHLMTSAMALGSTDPRWMTYKQAAELKAQVRKGEKSTAIEYWKKSVRKGEDADDGEDAPTGKQSLTVFHARVFHASQIDGLPAWEPKPAPTETWRHDECERLLSQAGVPIEHGAADAFYRPGTDTIHLPDKARFHSMDGYYATALHELGHATGHPSRLNRDLSGGFGSERYAREELRAEIASMMAGEALGIGHDPQQHHAYVASWIQVLKDDPKEILRAASDAQKIIDHLGIEPPTPEAIASVEVDHANAATWRAEFNTELLKGYAIGIDDAGIDDQVLARYRDLSAREAAQTYADDYDLTAVSVWDMREENAALRSQRDGLKSALQRVLGDDPEPPPAAPQPKGVRL